MLDPGQDSVALAEREIADGGAWARRFTAGVPSGAHIEQLAPEANKSHGFWLTRGLACRPTIALRLTSSISYVHIPAIDHVVNEQALVPMVFDYAEAILEAGRALAPPEELRDHVYERYVEPQQTGWEPLVQTDEAAHGLERLDPVCLIEVDPATARHTIDYLGRTIAFCAPSCKRQFLADPQPYLIA